MSKVRIGAPWYTVSFLAILLGAGLVFVLTNSLSCNTSRTTGPPAEPKTRKGMPAGIEVPSVVVHKVHKIDRVYLTYVKGINGEVSCFITAGKFEVGQRVTLKAVTDE